MTFEEYNTLDQEQQLTYLIINGKYISGRTEHPFTYNLYSVDNFYCEVSCNTADESIHEVKSFVVAEELQFYLPLRK